MQTQRIPQLDGLRGLAISMVIVWHYVILPLRDQGSTSLHYLIVLGRLTWSGVDLFFVLSGFLIGGILLDQSASRDRFRTFYVRRAYRILPIYLLVCITVELSLFALRSSGRSMPWYSYLTFTQNLWMATHNTFVPVLSYTWSLAVEEQFYLTLPWIIFYLSRKTIVNVLLFTVLTLPVLRCLLFIVGYGDVAMHVLSPARADTLALGVLAAMIVRHQAALDLVVRAKNYFRVAALGPFVVLAVATLRDWRMGTPYMGLYGYSSIALCYFCLLLELVIFPNTKLAAWFCIAPLRWLGTISYGAYLLHQVINVVCNRLIASQNPGLLWTFISMAAATIATLGLAHLSWKLFESKLVSYGRRFTYNRRPASSFALPQPSEV